MSPSSQPTSLSFERILSWFGHFTPQLKLRLMSLRRETSEQKFEALMAESISVFRMVVFDLSKQPKGALRAQRVHQILDAEFAMNPVTDASCAAGCAACCSFPKQISEDDADLLALAVNSGEVTIDRRELHRQATGESVGKPCVFLGNDKRCQVYAMRPVACRKYHVTSPASACADPNGKVSPRLDLLPEIVASASLSLPDNKFGAMAKLVDDRLDGRFD